jgi:hypothetical protein
MKLRALRKRGAAGEGQLHQSFRQPKKSGLRQFHYRLSSPSVILLRDAAGDALREFEISESTVHTGNGDTCIRGRRSVTDHVVVRWRQKVEYIIQMLSRYQILVVKFA